ncbi:hypothetical protein M378DRAFT_166643 [Amanita muscaria Koide BX008]|uniref:Uncharacterized protein n=1 Tax=Amanita muscaria (strain Koide BX008) TaxID=946122 RepID=A0A0C2WXW1_AMAMK|nr:hypothetical protein M378DRAFT_166643 [Amanita muscaria Koide BX008]
MRHVLKRSTFLSLPRGRPRVASPTRQAQKHDRQYSDKGRFWPILKHDLKADALFASASPLVC